MPPVIWVIGQPTPKPVLSLYGTFLYGQLTPSANKSVAWTEGVTLTS